MTQTRSVHPKHALDRDRELRSMALCLRGASDVWHPSGLCLGTSALQCLHHIDSETSAHTKMTWNLAVQLAQQRDMIPSRILDLDKFHKGAYKNLIKFKKSKFKVLHLGQARRDMSRWWDKVIESSLAEKDLAILMNEKLGMNQKRALAMQKAKSYNELHQEQWGQAKRADSTPLFLWDCTCNAASRSRVFSTRMTWTCRAGPEEVTKMIVNEISLLQRLRELELFSCPAVLRRREGSGENFCGLPVP